MQGSEVPGPMRQYALTTPSTNGCYGLKMGPAVDHGLRACDYEYDYEYSNLIPGSRCPPVRYPTHKRLLHRRVLPRSSTYFAQHKFILHFVSIDNGNVKFYKNWTLNKVMHINLK